STPRRRFRPGGVGPFPATRPPPPWAQKRRPLRHHRNRYPPSPLATTDPSRVPISAVLRSDPDPAKPAAGCTALADREAGEDGDGSADGDGCSGARDAAAGGGPPGILSDPAPLPGFDAPGGAGAGGGALAEIFATTPVHVPPAESCTVSVGWNSPAPQECVADEPVAVAAAQQPQV